MTPMLKASAAFAGGISLLVGYTAYHKYCPTANRPKIAGPAPRP